MEFGGEDPGRGDSDKSQPYGVLSDYALTVVSTPVTNVFSPVTGVKTKYQNRLTLYTCLMLFSQSVFSGTCKVAPQQKAYGTEELSCFSDMCILGINARSYNEMWYLVVLRDEGVSDGTSGTTFFLITGTMLKRSSPVGLKGGPKRLHFAGLNLPIHTVSFCLSYSRDDKIFSTVPTGSVTMHRWHHCLSVELTPMTLRLQMSGTNVMHFTLLLPTLL